MKIKRISQVLSYGWIHSHQISKETGNNVVLLYLDIIWCFLKYKMWSNQYAKERMWLLSKAERNSIGNLCKEERNQCDIWLRRFLKDKKFYAKYGSPRYETTLYLREKRNKAYAKHFNTGEHLFVENDVHICQQHYLKGTLSIGNNVTLAKHVHIDYSGDLRIADNVRIGHGSIIESHSHSICCEDISAKDLNSIPRKIIINENVVIGANATILETCNNIGRFAIIGAGAVVRNPVPPYSIVIGNPARVIGFTFTPEEMVDFEEKRYAKYDRTPYHDYCLFYSKYFSERVQDIRRQISL